MDYSLFLSSQYIRFEVKTLNRSTNFPLRMKHFVVSVSKNDNIGLGNHNTSTTIAKQLHFASLAVAIPYPLLALKPRHQVPHNNLIQGTVDRLFFSFGETF